MTFEHNSFISKPFLRSIWALDYEAFKESDQEYDLYKLLTDWSRRSDLKETSAESAFIDTFFKTLWGYKQSGQHSCSAFSLYPQYPIKGGGMRGGMGSADLAMGWFDTEGVPQTPQILCEFKDIKSNLDAPQKSRSNPRSPIKQCLDYLSAARRGLFGNESVLPTWGIVTDMNEFRLYWYDRAPQQYLRFVIRPMDLFQGEGMLADDEKSRFDRFLFWKLFHNETLLTTGGRAKLEQLIAQQWVKERELENTFYSEYRAFREKLYNELLKHNPDFPGTKGELVRIAQKILDRLIFIFFCEDMGQALSFPPQIFRDFLITRSRDEYFNPSTYTIWAEMIALFKAMNEGTVFGNKEVNQFNGGLFADDSEMESLQIPNSIFCGQGQGQNEASLNADKETVLYLSAAYNYASDLAEGLKAVPMDETDPAKALKNDPSYSLGLYTLGRIFEQSITELEILEAEADGFLSINKENKRKRDGVYYTPELVVERIVQETLRPRLHEIKAECGWPERELPDEKAINQYQARLKKLKIVDPACGSGAFLITVLRYLMDEWHAVLSLRREITGKSFKDDDAALINDILRSNIYGVDINPASVEITRLALWLHTASGDKPLSSLDHTIRDGNSLIGPEFYKGQADIGFYDEVEKERINTFDWRKAFPEVFDQGGFDAVVGNPPYVKLQNFRKVHADMAEFLKNDSIGTQTYESTQSGNFDLYLPFIEKGLQLLNDTGRLGYIAPSLWTVNEYGAALRKKLIETRQLVGWIDFGSYQVFDEATVYTALQFYTKGSNDFVKVAFAPDGSVPDDPWGGKDSGLPYDKLEFGDRWLLLSGKDRKLIDKIYKNCDRLDNPEISEAIFQGMVTSADSIYHLDRVGSNLYQCKPKGRHLHPYEIEIEDEIMKPLVSGVEAKRYELPRTNTYLLFPYDIAGKKGELISKEDLATKYPKAWAYIKSYEKELRGRESGKMDIDDKWWGYVYPKNLKLHEDRKIVVPRIVVNLCCSVDEDNNFYLDNVDVGGIRINKTHDPHFIAGILNAPVANFVFKRISKPFRGGYRSANKQFIAPLPIPITTVKKREAVAKRAKALKKLYTKRRDTLNKLEKRMEMVNFKAQPETFLFPDLKEAGEYFDEAPKRLGDLEKETWAKKKYQEDLQGRYDEITARLHPAAAIEANLEDGELSFSIDGVPVLGRIFVDEEDGWFILAQWKVFTQTFSITDKTDGKKLCHGLRKIAVTDNPALRTQVIELESDLTELECQIKAEEESTNELVYKLYGLTNKEVALIEME